MGGPAFRGGGKGKGKHGQGNGGGGVAGTVRRRPIRLGQRERAALRLDLAEQARAAEAAGIDVAGACAEGDLNEVLEDRDDGLAQRRRAWPRAWWPPRIPP
eukprot:3792000-Alexandrium_andersonii.AAC.1